MNTMRATLTALAALTLMAAHDVAAQRRTTSGGGGEGRGTPSGGGNTASQPPSRGSSGTAAAPASTARGGASQPNRASRSGNASATRGSRNGVSSSGTRSGSGGKISRVRQEARRPAGGGGGDDVVVVGPPVYVGGCWGCGWWGGYGGYGMYPGGWWYPAYPYPMGYLPEDHPPVYRDEEEPVDSAQQTRPTAPAPRRKTTFGFITGQYYSDMGSTTQAGHVALEGVVGVFRAQVEYGQYVEQLRAGTDHLQTGRASIGLMPGVGSPVSLTFGIGVRTVFLEGGDDGWGPEGELGMTIRPVSLLGASISGRLASLNWRDGVNDPFRELNTTASLFLGGLEIQGGWHWMKIGDAPAFGGPMAGVRLHF